jgi:hypothetical protein
MVPALRTSRIQPKSKNGNFFSRFLRRRPHLGNAGSPLLVNHVGTAHASAQFALAEASRDEFLLRYLGEIQSQAFAVLRGSHVKFRKPAHGAFRDSARFADGIADSLFIHLAFRGRALMGVIGSDD